MYVNLRKVNELGVDYLVSASYIDSLPADSIKTNLDGKIVEQYNFNLLYKIEEGLLKGEIIEDKIIKDTTQYGTRIKTVVYKGKYRNVIVKEEECYLRDTVLQEGGRAIKCFVTETKSTIEYKKGLKKISEEFIYKRSYYGKDIGLLMYIIENKDDSQQWFQMGIWPLRTEKELYPSPFMPAKAR